MIPVIIVGKMGSGKTIVADLLKRDYNYVKFSMATWLKKVIHDHYGIHTPSKALSIKDKPIREYYQALGESLRRIDPMWHIDEVIADIKCNEHDTRFVIDDIRYHNEAEELKKHFKCISIKVASPKLTRVERIILRDMVVPTETQLTNPSEEEVDGIIADFEIINDGSIDDLFNKVHQIIRRDIHEKFRSN